MGRLHSKISLSNFNMTNLNGKKISKFQTTPVVSQIPFFIINLLRSQKKKRPTLKRPFFPTVGLNLTNYRGLGGVYWTN